MERLLNSILTPAWWTKLFTRKVEITYNPGKYVQEFDGWRGLGIIFVVLAHYAPQLFRGSWVFMEMFFVMSGFLITGILVDAKGKEGYFKSFISRRIVRVFPLYYISLFIFLFLIPNSWLDSSHQRENQIWYWLYVENWLFSIEGWPQVKGFSHFWSLAIEEQFYILWPFVVLLFSNKGLIRFCIFLFFFSIAFRNIGLELGFVMPFPYVATFARMEGIVLGAIIAVLTRTNKDILEKITFPVTIISGVLAIAVFAVAGTMHMEYPVNYRINYTLVDIFFAGMITLTLCKQELYGLKLLFNTSILKKLGIMSYCIYIFHRPIQIIVLENFYPLLLEYVNSDALSKFICGFISFCIMVPVVYLIHKKIEMPIWRLKKYF